MPHSQAPWHCHHHTPTTVKNSAGDWIADCEMPYISYAKGSRDEREANARLISAAPELLAALLDCVLVMERDLAGLSIIQPELAAARAALAKATGGA